MRQVAFGVLVAVVAGSTGCTSAHYVKKGPDSGVVAIPENTDVWPTHYKTAAIELIESHVGKNNYVILEQGQVATGGRPDANPMAPPPNAPPSTTEWRITYAKKPPQPTVPLNVVPIGPGSMPLGARPISGPPLPGSPIVTQMGGTQPPPNAYMPGGLTGAGPSTIPGVGPMSPLGSMSPSSPISPGIPAAGTSPSPYPYGTPTLNRGP